MRAQGCRELTPQGFPSAASGRDLALPAAEEDVPEAADFDGPVAARPRRAGLGKKQGRRQDQANSLHRALAADKPCPGHPWQCAGPTSEATTAHTRRHPACRMDWKAQPAANFVHRRISEVHSGLSRTLLPQRAVQAEAKYSKTSWGTHGQTTRNRCPITWTKTPAPCS